jgi:hypothetical protein
MNLHHTRPVAWVFGLACAFCAFQSVLLATLPQEADDKASAPGKNRKANRSDPQRVMGIVKSDCKKCHPSEVAHWMKTTHAQSSEKRLYKFEGNTEKYAKALGLNADQLLGDSTCATCHGTKAIVNNTTKVISSVSCESCHGAAGGEDGWLNRHQSYHASMPIPRAKETAEHRAERLKAVEAAGMIRSTNIYEQAKSCFGCHIVGEEKLVAAGHKAASAIEFVSWSSGEVRHNFFVDKTKNSDAPTLWAERTGGNVENRRRVKFVVGTLVQLEMALRHRAKAKNPVVIPQLGAVAAATSGRLAQINGLAGTPETQAAVVLATPLLGTLFVPQPTDAKTYADVADKVAEQARKFAKAHDGSKLKGLDALIKALPPHFSQQYKAKNP